MSTEYLRLDDYNDNSFVVRAGRSADDTKQWQTQLEELGGRWNPRLKGGSGHIFSQTKRDVVQDFIIKVNKGLVKPQGPSAKPKGKATPVITAHEVADVKDRTTVVQAKPIEVNSQKYQAITYLVVLPTAGQKIKVDFESEEEPKSKIYVVKEALAEEPPFDRFYLEDADAPGNYSELQIVCGAWTIKGDLAVRSIEFM